MNASALPSTPAGWSRRSMLGAALAGLGGLGAGRGWALPQAGSSVPRLLGAQLPPAPDLAGRAVIERVLAEARRLGVQQPIEWLPWVRVLTEAQAQGNALVFPLLRLPEREAQWRWLVPLGRADLVLWVRRDAVPGALDIEALRRLEVGVLRGSALLPHLQTRGFVSVHEVSSEMACAGMLARGRIQAWASLRPVAEAVLASQPLPAVALHAPWRLSTADFYLAATLDWSGAA